MFGSAAKRWCGENIIARYQMTVLLGCLAAETLCSRTVADAFPANVRALDLHEGVRISVDLHGDVFAP